MTQLELPLSLAEKDLLAECEVVIERGMGVFIETGEALMTVRDSRLYRAEFATFEEYCRQRWQLSSPYANQLISAARVVETITDAIASVIDSEVDIPATESQSRELAPLLDDPQELREVWQEAIERTDGKPLHLRPDSSLLVGNQNNQRTAWLVISVLNGIREAPSLFDALPSDRRPIPDSLRRAVYERDGWACVRCGRTSDLTVDHKWPHIRGGALALENLQTLCAPCNTSKNDATDQVA